MMNIPITRMMSLMLTSYRIGGAILSAPPNHYPRSEKRRDAVRRFLSPIDYFRYGELPVAGELLAPLAPDHRVLDLSSPKLLAFHLAVNRLAKVTTVDLLEENLAEWRLAARSLKLEEQIHIDTADGRKLSYPDGAFDHAFSISVLEHIPEDGDTLTMQELSRVLKPGGSLVVTVPCRPISEEVYLNQDIYERVYDGTQPIFWCRYYDEAGFYQRLVEPSGLEVDKITFLYESIPYWERFCKLPNRLLQQIQMPFWPFLAAISFRVGPEYPLNKPLSIGILKLRKPR